MTTLTVLGSGSRGNAVGIATAGGALLVDAGFSARELRRRAALAGFPLDAVAGIALTHEHGDHASGAPRLARELGVPVLASGGTLAALAPKLAGAATVPLAATRAAALGPFALEAATTSHDAAEPIALRVCTADGAAIGIAYDLGRPTAGVRWLLREATALVLEANHDDVLLRTSSYPPSVQQRIAGAGGHLSNRACAELLEELHHPGLVAVVLAHLSERCNAPAAAEAAVTEALRRAGYAGVVLVAPQDGPLAPLDVRPRLPAQLGFAL